MSRFELRGGALRAALLALTLTSPAAHAQLSPVGLLHLEQGIGGKACIAVEARLSSRHFIP